MNEIEGSVTIKPILRSDRLRRKERRICCRMNIEIKGSHARAVTSGVSDHLPISSDDRLHNIFVNAFARVPANSIIAARHNCRERTIALSKPAFGRTESVHAEIRRF